MTLERNLSQILPSESWFVEWLQLWPSLESPETFLLFQAMSCFGACLGRSCWFDQDFVKIYPMLNLLLIGPSGVGKSTTIHLGLDLIRALDDPDLKPNLMGPATREKLHFDLVTSSKAILVASELANFFNKAKYMEGMIPYITELLDYGPYIEQNTKASGIVRVDDPAVTIIGGSTVDWLQDQLPDSAATGGFLARFLIVSEEHKSQRVALPGLYLSPAQRERMERRRADAQLGFQTLLYRAPRGVVKLRDYEVAERFQYWYTNQKTETGYLAPFVERSREVVLRLALLIAISCTRDSIYLQDVEAGIRLYEIATQRLRQVVVPVTAEGKLLAGVLKAMGWQARTVKEICRSLDAQAPAQKIEQLLESHLRTGAIERRTDGRLIRVR